MNRLRNSLSFACLLAWVGIFAAVGEKVPSTFPANYGYGFVGAEFLYMAADQDGLSYAWTFPEIYPAAIGHYNRQGPLPNGTSHDVDFSWNPGFRLLAGYRFEAQSWEASLIWTYYQSHSQSSASISSLATDTLIATWFPAGFRMAAFVAEDASLSWTLHFNTLDLCLARSSFATSRVSIDPYMAFTGAFIHQQVKSSYNNGSFLNQTGGGAGAENVSMSMQNNFDGWGLKPGVRTNWFLNKQWSLYANGAASLLCGRFATEQKGVMSGAADLELLDAEDSFFQNAYAMELAVGAKWAMFFNSQKRRLSVSVGYEMMSWFDQNQLFNYFFIDQAPGAGQPSQGDLGLQGINASMQVDF